MASDKSGYEILEDAMDKGDCPSDCPYLVIYTRPYDASCKILDSEVNLWPESCPLYYEEGDES